MDGGIGSIYIHIPFCKTKCPYCDFASWANKEDQIDKYFNALISEIKTKCEAYQNGFLNSKKNKQKSNIKTIFIGGGTPSMIPPEYYETLFAELKNYFNISNDCEITMEANPGTVKKEHLSGYNKLGVNRISIGAQSFDPLILEILGRKHSIEETIEAIEITKSSGFENFNLDFIFSVPGMTKEIWINSIKKALEYKPKHISAYSLIIEPGTPFEHIYKDPKSLLPDDTAYEFYLSLCEILKDNDFIHYEISNFAIPGYESKHNLNYWFADAYFAFGVSAHRFINGLRTSNTKDLNSYILNPNIENVLDYPINYNFEKLMLNSRLSNGFDLTLVKKVSTKSPVYITEMLNDLSKEGFLELNGEKVHLTDKGMFLNNEVLLKLI